MTIIERIKAAESRINTEFQNGGDLLAEDNDNIEKLIYLAYRFGREDATREISDQYNALIDDMRKRANACRYRHMANDVIGEHDYIYSPLI